MVLGIVLKCDPAVGAISVCTMPWKLLYVSTANKVCCADIRTVRQVLSFGCRKLRLRIIVYRALPEYDGPYSAAFKFLSWKSVKKK